MKRQGVGVDLLHAADEAISSTLGTQGSICTICKHLLLLLLDKIEELRLFYCNTTDLEESSIYNY